jgi:hypothetical protein
LIRRSLSLLDFLSAARAVVEGKVNLVLGTGEVVLNEGHLSPGPLSVGEVLWQNALEGEVKDANRPLSVAARKELAWIG